MKKKELLQVESLRYAIGLSLALATTYLAFFAAVNQWFSQGGLAFFLLLTATAQFVVQLVLFLHVNQESKPRWTIWSIVFIFLMMLVVVVGTLWIMANLNYNMHTTPEQMQQYMLEQNKKGF